MISYFVLFHAFIHIVQNYENYYKADQSDNNDNCHFQFRKSPFHWIEHVPWPSIYKGIYLFLCFHFHNIWSSILYVWIRCEPRSLQVTLSVCLFVAYFEQTTSCARSCMNELINDISWLFPSKMTPHKGLCAFIFIEYALCAWIMHYVVCIMHYASCIMHHALSNIHCVSWLIIKKSNGFFKIPLSSGNVTPCKSFFFINIFVYACMHGHFIMYACN